MSRWFVLFTLVALATGSSGCSKPEGPKTDPEGKAIKAPETPPSGV